MFLRAGFNFRFRTVAHALVVWQGRWRWAQMIVFVPSGDLGWYIRGRALAWFMKPCSHCVRLPVEFCNGPRSRFPNE